MVMAKDNRSGLCERELGAEDYQQWHLGRGLHHERWGPAGPLIRMAAVVGAEPFCPVSRDDRSCKGSWASSVVQLPNLRHVQRQGKPHSGLSGPSSQIFSNTSRICAVVGQSKATLNETRDAIGALALVWISVSALYRIIRNYRRWVLTSKSDAVFCA